MRNYLDVLLEELLSCSKNSGIDAEIFSKDKKQIKLEFRKILDKLAVSIIENNLENEMLKQALLELARIERIIIVFHFLCGMKLSEIAFLLETDLNNVY